MKEDSSEFRIDHHNGPDPEVEKALELASMPEKHEESKDESGEEVTISAKDGLEVEATEVKEAEGAPDEKPAPKEVVKEQPKAPTQANYWLPRVVIFLVLGFVLIIAIMAIVARYK